jgi:hypothetical protein
MPDIVMAGRTYPTTWAKPLGRRKRKAKDVRIFVYSLESWKPSIECADLTSDPIRKGKVQ